jgi:putative ATP-dependent endonuclease of the OLD family
MRIARVHIINYRCLTELELTFDDVTVFVGANSTGKSTVLHAILWFFEGGTLETEDLPGNQPDCTASVGVTFTDFDDADRDALGSYLIGEEATFWRTWSAAEGEKLTGRGRAYPPFEEIRAHEAAMPMRKAYSELRASRPDLGLPAASSQAAVKEALLAWEEAHPEDLEEARVSATHLFGFTGGSRLNGRFDFVLIQAVADPEAETRDARGTLLRQLLERAMGDQPTLRSSLEQLEREVVDRVHTIVRAEGGAALATLSRQVSEELQRLVPEGQVTLEPREPVIRIPDFVVDLRVAEGGLETAVGRQGHGFQRALLIAVVQQLAALRPADGTADEAVIDAEATPPALFLAIEEPELYQHPAQARHFAATLASLASSGQIQVAYATHSEHFVDPARYEQLRRFRRRAGAAWPMGEATRATTEDVAVRLQDLVPVDEVPTRIRLTLRRQLAEAVFARAVLIVEGHSDAGFLHGVADRTGGFDIDGIAVVFGMGKTQLAVPWAVLTELDIPTYVVLDGDSGRAGRLREQGRDQAVAQLAQEVRRENRLLFAALGAPLDDQPDTTVSTNFAVFRDNLEDEATHWEGYQLELDRCRADLSDWRGKSEDAYRLAAASTPADPPSVFVEIIDAVRALA